jgi:hypothetical protein
MLILSKSVLSLTGILFRFIIFQTFIPARLPDSLPLEPGACMPAQPPDMNKVGKPEAADDQKQD